MFNYVKNLDDQSNNSDSSDDEVIDFELETMAKYDMRCLALAIQAILMIT